MCSSITVFDKGQSVEVFSDRKCALLTRHRRGRCVGAVCARLVSWPMCLARRSERYARAMAALYPQSYDLYNNLNITSIDVYQFVSGEFV